MGAYILRRLLLMIPTLLGISLLVFALMHILPGDVVDGMIGAEDSFTPAQRETLERLVGLDKPLYVQYADWLGALLTLDLGSSFRSSEPVLTLIGQRIGVTV